MFDMGKHFDHSKTAVAVKAKDGREVTYTKTMTVTRALYTKDNAPSADLVGQRVRIALIFRKGFRGGAVRLPIGGLTAEQIDEKVNTWMRSNAELTDDQWGKREKRSSGTPVTERLVNGDQIAETDADEALEQEIEDQDGAEPAKTETVTEKPAKVNKYLYEDGKKTGLNPDWLAQNPESEEAKAQALENA